MGKWHRKANPEIVPYADNHMTFDKDTKAIQWRIVFLFNRWYESNWIFIDKKKQKTNLDSKSTIYTKITQNES